MDKRLKITEIAARTQLSISTVSRVLAGKANTSEKARAKVLACARELGVMDGMAAGVCCLTAWWFLPRSGRLTSGPTSFTTA